MAESALGAEGGVELSPRDDKNSVTETSIASDDADDVLLLKMGYKPTLFRGLGALMNFAFGFTEVAVLASIAITFPLGLTNGGPAVVFWGFFVNFMVTMVIAYSMAEICSAYPSAGSVYHWAGQLASENHAPLWSYICGWFNFLGTGNITCYQVVISHFVCIV